MDHALQFFQNLDNLVWGAPLLVLLVGTASDSLFTQGFSVDLYGR